MYRLAAAALLAASSAQAQGLMPNTPTAVLSIAQQVGTAVMESPDSDGRPVINGVIDGVNYGILFYGCENAMNCASLQFFARFDPPADPLRFINTWNYDKRFAAAYQRDDGAIILNFNVNIDFGVSQANAEDSFDIWSILLGQFDNRINGRPDDAGSGGGGGK